MNAGGPAGASRPRAAFYCVSGRDFFPGAVALLNSLRLHDHREPLFVLDCGLTDSQRNLLRPHATLVKAPADAPPSTLKLIAPRAHPAEVMVLLDSDLILTRPLHEQLGIAGEGRVVAFANDTNRYFREWSELLDLPPVRREPYLTSSAIFAGGEPGADLMAAMARAQPTIEPRRTWIGGGVESDPLFFFDQDVFNAVARSLIDPAEVMALPARLAPIPPFAGVRIVDEAALRCSYRDGTEPCVLHHASHKPWLVRMRSNVFSRLLTRLLLGPDVAVRLRPEELPLRLRTGAAARAERAGTDLLLTAPGIARRLRRRQPTVPAWPNPPAR